MTFTPTLPPRMRKNIRTNQHKATNDQQNSKEKSKSSSLERIDTISSIRGRIRRETCKKKRVYGGNRMMLSPEPLISPGGTEYRCRLTDTRDSKGSSSAPRSLPEKHEVKKIK